MRDEINMCFTRFIAFSSSERLVSWIMRNHDHDFMEITSNCTSILLTKQFHSRLIKAHHGDLHSSYLKLDWWWLWWRRWWWKLWWNWNERERKEIFIFTISVLNSTFLCNRLRFFWSIDSLLSSVRFIGDKMYDDVGSSTFTVDCDKGDRKAVISWLKL